MSETTRSIYEWGLKTFEKQRDPAVYIGRALQEFVELIELLGEFEDCQELKTMRNFAQYLKSTAVLSTRNDAAAAEEIADVEICLEHALGMVGRDGQLERDKKMKINRQREWVVTKEGTRHV